MSIKTKTKAKLLGSVGTTVLATMIASGAHAGGITIDDTLTVNVRGSQTVTGTLDLVNPINANSGAVGATISGVSAGISRDGTQTGVTETVSGNRINASATGNRFANAIDLSLVENGANDGAVSLGVARNQTVDPDGGVATVTSLVQASSFFIDDLDFLGGSVSAVGNTISVVTAVNDGGTSLAGNIPTGFASTTAGSSNLSFPGGDVDGNLFASTGSLVAGSVQQNLEGGHRAAVTGNAIALSLASTDNYTLSGSPALDDNTISATLKGNTAGSTIDIGSADAPVFAGSAVVTNLQLNASGELSASRADNLGSQISATITGEAAGALYELEGGLSVDGNRISSSITGNEALGTTGVAGNRILLGDGLSFAGAGGDAAGSTMSYTGGGVESSVTADLAIQNSQGNQGVSAAAWLSFSATTADGQVLATVQSIDDGSVSQSANRVTAAVAGNAASSALANGQNAASFEGTVALANQQSNHNTDLSATNSGATVATLTGNGGGVTHNSSVGVTGNRVAATGYGNDVSQSVDLNATILLAGAGNASLTGGTAAQGNVSASGNVTISSLQSGYGSNLTVANSGSAIRLSADSQGPELGGDTVLGSTLTVGTNAQEAIALGNTAGNALSLEGTTVGSGAGVANVQILDGNSGVSATLSQAGTELTAGTDVEGSSLSVTGNMQRAIGYGSSASNALSVSANAITVGEADAPLASVINAAEGSDLPFSNTVGSQPVVNAAYGILNDQSSRADVTANAEGGQIGLAVEGDLRQSSARNELNAIVAAAYGNDAASAIAIDAGNIGIDILDEGEGAAVANVTNTQAVAADISATASGVSVIQASVDGDVIGSSLSASKNLIQALATGNRATDNSVTVTGTNIEAAGDDRGGVTFDTDSGALAANASFSVQNAQSAQGTVTASQLDDPDSLATAAGVLVSALGDVIGSSVAADGNRSLASATANSAANALSIDVSRLATTSAVQNFQSARADVTALIGLPGTPPTPGTSDAPFNFTVEGDNVVATVTGGVATLTAGTLYTLISALSPDQTAQLQAEGWEVGTGIFDGYLVISATILGSMPSASFNALDAGNPTSLAATVPGIPASDGVPNQGGVTVAVGADITGSSISVSDNVTAGSVTGNAASNALKIAATDISAGNDLAASTAGSLSADVIGAVADHALSNLQEVSYEEGAAYIAARVHGAFAIDAAEGATISGSSLAISGNTQSATAVANTAGNTLALDGTNVSTGSALASDQWADALVSVLSNLEIFAPAAVNGSSVDISGNINTALGVINDATNTLTVTGTNIASVGTAGEVLLTGDLVGDLWSATGDHVLSNRQTAYTAVDATALTQIYNKDGIAAETLGVSGSSVTFSGNRTVSEASANRADNKLTLDAASTLSANGGIVNRQDSEASVSALSSTLAGIALAGDATSAALDGSSVKVDGNSTTALARGNAATNVLNAVAGSSYGASTAGAGSSVGTGGLETRAGAAVLNGQTNSGAVSAASFATVYAVALNGTTGIANGSVSVSDNRIASEAYGNSAVNKVSLTGLNTGTSSAAVSSYQVNSGAITASVTQAGLGVTGTGAVGGSSLGVKGNTISANAVGNSVSNAISRN